MVCCPPSGYIIFSLRNLKFYEGWGLRAGYEGRGPDNSKTPENIHVKYKKYFQHRYFVNQDSCYPVQFSLKSLQLLHLKQEPAVIFTKGYTLRKLRSGRNWPRDQFINIISFWSKSSRQLHKKEGETSFQSKVCRTSFASKNLEKTPIGKTIFYCWC